MRAMIGCVLTLAVLACSSAPVPKNLLDSERSAIRASTDSFTAYVLTHRDSLAAALYTNDATLMPPNHAPVRGRDAIRKFIKQLPPLTHFTASAIEIDGRADLAYVRGTYQMTSLAGGKDVTDFGKFLQIRRRQPNGIWLTALDIFNSDVPAPAPAAPTRTH